MNNILNKLNIFQDSLISTTATPLKPLLDLPKGSNFGTTKRLMNNLVRIKTRDDTTSFEPNINATTTSKEGIGTSDPPQSAANSSALTLLGSYSGSDSDSN